MLHCGQLIAVGFCCQYGVVLQRGDQDADDVVMKFINLYNNMKKTPKLVSSDDITVMSRPQPSLLIVPCLIKTRLLTDIKRVVESFNVKSGEQSSSSSSSVSQLFIPLPADGLYSSHHALQS